MHFGVQRLHAAIEHFRKTRVVAYVNHFEASIANELRGTTGGEKLYAMSGERFCEVEEAGFVGNREEGACDLAVHTGFFSLS